MNEQRGVELCRLDEGGFEIAVSCEEDEYGDPAGWVARLVGARHGGDWARVFLMPSSRRREGGRGWVMRWRLDLKGVYQIARGATERSCWHLGASGSPERLDDESALKRVRSRVGASREEVEVACLHGRWEEALDRAWMIFDERERACALTSVWEARYSHSERGLPRLEGSARQRQWAELLRDEALGRLVALGGPTSAPDAERLNLCAAATEALYARRSASAWIARRAELKSGEEAIFFGALLGDGVLTVDEVDEFKSQ